MTSAQPELSIPSEERSGGRRRVGRKTPRGVIALLAAWLGAVLFFGAGVAPAAFAVLPTPADAGALVGRLLPALFYAGIGTGLVLAICAVRLRTGGSLVRRAMAIAGALMTLGCALAQFWVAPELARVLAEAGAMDARSPDDPLRLEFGRLHGMSVVLLGIAWLGGVVMLFIASLAPAPRALAPEAGKSGYIRS
ncbi:MAG TPA: DUF4149 domain-containing protein [Gemmatimonadaceae bacterium]|nr:DUF4149 domain-containing protein [Gemmatimonadaceae bacterium]